MLAMEVVKSSPPRALYIASEPWPGIFRIFSPSPPPRCRTNHLAVELKCPPTKWPWIAGRRRTGGSKLTGAAKKHHQPGLEVSHKGEKVIISPCNHPPTHPLWTAKSYLQIQLLGENHISWMNTTNSSFMHAHLHFYTLLSFWSHFRSIGLGSISLWMIIKFSLLHVKEYLSLGRWMCRAGPLGGNMRLCRRSTLQCLLNIVSRKKRQTYFSEKIAERNSTVVL